MPTLHTEATGTARFGYYYNNPEYTVYANDYETSSVRSWLNGAFFQTAFTGTEQSAILTTELDKQRREPDFFGDKYPKKAPDNQDNNVVAAERTDYVVKNEQRYHNLRKTER